MTLLANSAIAVRAVAVAKSYASATASVQALRDITIEIGRGERVALLGKSGSGKSTLLNLLGGLDRPSAGSLWVNGHELARLTPGALAHYRLTTVGMIFQSYNLIATRTAVQNVELPLVFTGIRPRERWRAAREALTAVGLEHRLHHRPAELSGGESQRVAIARALINRPEILLADEPTGNLDTTTAGEIMALLTAHLDAHGTTLILVTHDEDLARRSGSRILHMQDGRLI